MSKDKLASVLNEIFKFIKSLDSVGDDSRDVGHDLFFSIADEGTIILSSEEAVHYRECLITLSETVGDEFISPKAIEALYQRAILTAIDIQKNERAFLLNIELEPH